jgi:hypothetical protein
MHLIKENTNMSAFLLAWKKIKNSSLAGKMILGMGLFAMLVLGFNGALAVKYIIVNVREVDANSVFVSETQYHHKHGDDVALGLFLQEHLSPATNRVIAPSKGESRFFKRFWEPLLSIYLYPVPLEVNDYPATLTQMEAEQLEKQSLFQQTYWNRRLDRNTQFYFIEVTNPAEVPQYCLYEAVSDGEEKIFIVPFDWDGMRCVHD